MKRQLLTNEDAIPTKQQHVSPCSDCPWARKSLPGWLGGTSIGRWLWSAHHDGRIECHTRETPDGGSHQCAGAAIYRANVCKSVYGTDNLELPADRTRVFTQALEFASHHSKGKVRTPKQVQKLFTSEMNSIREEALDHR